MAALLVALLLLFSFTTPVVAEEDDGSKKSVLTESVTVSASRVPDEPLELDRTPASVTVIDRDGIERSGARTLQDLLALETGVVLYDQVGNGLERTVDLRGFSEGTSIKLFLDGAPLNDPRNNSLSLHLVPLEALERIEVRRGPAASMAGGGAEGGVIHLLTRRGEGFGGAIAVDYGSDDSTGFSGVLRDNVGAFDYFISADRESTDGFRQNGGGDLRRLSGAVGFDLSAGHRLQLSVLDSDSQLGNPGAMTMEQVEADPWPAENNLLDFADDSFSQATLNFTGTLGADWSIAANLFRRDRELDSLATGRAAQTYGGSYMEMDAGVLGSVVQFAHVRRSERYENHLTIGVEYLDGDTEASGYSTPVEDLAHVDPDALTSHNITDRRTAAVFLREEWRPSAVWNLTAGLRLDDDRISYTEFYPEAGYSDDRSYSELSLSAGLNRKLNDNHALYASYGEAFLPPTVEELFAFPLYGSNRELQPEDSRSWEVGFRSRFDERLALDAALFLTDTDDEIVFDPDAPPGLFGTNVNAGKTRREGIEVSLRGRLTSHAGYFVNATLLDAEFREGEISGNDVPLVPGERYAAGLDFELPGGLALRTELLYVGEQTLSNDDTNDRAPLDSYTVVDLRATWDLPGAESMTLFVDVTNLFDLKYATRGIFAYDFLADPEDPDPYDDFFTPAPGRRLRAGVRWKF